MSLLPGSCANIGPSVLNIARCNVNVAPQYRRALEIGLQQTMGYCARAAPCLLGDSFSLDSLVVAQLAVTSYGLNLRHENSQTANFQQLKKKILGECKLVILPTTLIIITEKTNAESELCSW